VVTGRHTLLSADESRGDADRSRTFAERRQPSRVTLLANGRTPHRFLIVMFGSLMGLAQVLWGLHLAVVPWVVSPQHPMTKIAGSTITDPLEAMVMNTDGGSSVELARHLAAGGAGLGSFGFTLDSSQHGAYRAQRVGQPALVAALSGGDDRRVLLVNSAVSIVAVGLLTALVAHLLERLHGSWRWALLVPFVPGLISATLGATSDVLSLAAMLGALVALRSQRSMMAITLATFAGLTRETWLPVIVLIAFTETSMTRRARFVWCAASMVAYGLWAVVVHSEIGPWPFLSGSGNLVFVPLKGAAWFAARDESLLAPVAGLCALVAGVIGLYRLSRRDRTLATIGWFHVVQVCFLSGATWNLAANLNRVTMSVAVIGLMGLAVVRSYGAETAPLATRPAPGARSTIARQR
jgi:hypothetical protein